MIYHMNLAEEPFALIENRQKDIEMRLCSKGRENIRPGDQIIFTNNKSGKQLMVEVVSVSKFISFHELYKRYDKTRLGYKIDETENPDDMLKYYKLEDIEKYGVLAIEIKI